MWGRSKISLVMFTVLLIAVFTLTIPPQIAQAAPGDFIVVDAVSSSLFRVTPAGSVSVIASGIGTSPQGVAIDSGGDFIVAGGFGNLFRVTPAGSVSLIAGLLGSSGVTIDSGGDFIVTTGFFGNLLRVTPAGSVSVIASGIPFANDVAIDSGGDFIVTSATTGTLFRVTPAGSVSFIASIGVGNTPLGIAIDSGGDFIVSTMFNGLLRVTPAGSVSVIASGIGVARDVAIDSGGDFIVTIDSGGLIRVTPAGSVSVITPSGLGSPRGVAIEPASQTPETPSELIDSIEDLGLPSNVENSLKAPLKNAQDKLDDNNPKNDGAACGKMDAFINMVNAQEGKKLTTEQAEELREAAQSVKDSIGC